ncbi:MAG: ADP-glyceromanno-heptose 6-epimerase [Bacteroidota bacterium]
MIVVTGAYGFIGSALIAHLNAQGIKDIIAVDDFSKTQKEANLADKQVSERIERGEFLAWLKDIPRTPDYIFHLGARTDTTEFDRAIFDDLNVEYSKAIWDYCTDNFVPLVYASSAATYGGGENGYEDDESKVSELQPLNPYGVSKQEFDLWVLEQDEQPPLWAGLKFFNVYGPNEYHKGRMASVVFHAYNQITATGGMKLFRSHNPDFKDGEQQRDFVYVKDVVNVCDFFRTHAKAPSGIYNLGTGKARTFLDLVKAVFAALSVEPNISFIDTPADIRDKYQYFTEATMEKLKAAGYATPFTSLEEGVKDYVKNYLVSQRIW